VSRHAIEIDLLICQEGFRKLILSNCDLLWYCCGSTRESMLNQDFILNNRAFIPSIPLLKDHFTPVSQFFFGVLYFQIFNFLNTFLLHKLLKFLRQLAWSQSCSVISFCLFLTLLIILTDNQQTSLKQFNLLNDIFFEQLFTWEQVQIPHAWRTLLVHS
jgi:hypothetical protein